MFLLFIELGYVVEITNDSIDTHTDKARCACLLEDMQVLTFTVPDQGCKQHEPLTLWHCHDRIDHLAHGLRFQGDAMGWTAWVTYTRKK